MRKKQHKPRHGREERNTRKRERQMAQRTLPQKAKSGSLLFRSRGTANNRHKHREIENRKTERGKNGRPREKGETKPPSPSQAHAICGQPMREGRRWREKERRSPRPTLRRFSAASLPSSLCRPSRRPGPDSSALPVLYETRVDDAEPTASSDQSPVRFGWVDPAWIPTGRNRARPGSPNTGQPPGLFSGPAPYKPTGPDPPPAPTRPPSERTIRQPLLSWRSDLPVKLATLCVRTCGCIGERGVDWRVSHIRRRGMRDCHGDVDLEDESNNIIPTQSGLHCERPGSFDSSDNFPFLHWTPPGHRRQGRVDVDGDSVGFFDSEADALKWARAVPSWPTWPNGCEDHVWANGITPRCSYVDPALRGICKTTLVFLNESFYTPLRQD